MRLIDSKKKCKSSERTLSWGNKGATGAKGSNGKNGVSTVLVKRLGSNFVYIDAPSAVLSASVPRGKYSFQFSSEVTYSNNGVDTLRERYLGCLITTNSNSATALSSEPAEKAMVLWPITGENYVFRTSFSPSEASNREIAGRAYAISGTLDIATDSNIYLQCRHEQQIDDVASANQYAGFYFSTLTLIKADEIVAMN